ncbi:MAG: CaiB/BaiF CoA-transferase family protein [Moraxella sp.]|nr:CaiB/BaiF CoA-transferase family protein [Moraxella sp.]
MQALQGITVVDLSRVLAAPSCTQILADFGARVIKIERPHTGDETRQWNPPNFTHADGSTTSAYFATVNRNKQSIAIDITTADGQHTIKELIKTADVLVENFKVGNLAKYGLDYASLSAINPRLIYASLTGFGQTGMDAHKAGYDYIIQGLSGLMSITGETDGQPQKVGVAVADLFAGLQLTVGILTALHARTHTGKGQWVDVALLDSSIAMLANIGMNNLATGDTPQRLGNSHASIVPYQVFAASDGHFIVACGNDGQFARLCAVLGQGWHSDERFATNPSRVMHRDTLVPMLQDVFIMHTRSHWIERLESAGVPCGAINDVAEALNLPQVIEREMIHTFDNGVKVLGNPIKLSDTPATYRSPPPGLGEHNTIVF